jgi:hypothetical protein
MICLHVLIIWHIWVCHMEVTWQNARLEPKYIHTTVSVEQLIGVRCLTMTVHLVPAAVLLQSTLMIPVDCSDR